MNLAAFTGYFCADPTIRSTPSGKMVTSFTIGVQDPEIRDATDFIDCVAWEGRAEFICNNFKKGMKIELSGKMKTRVSEYKGVKIKHTELVCKTANFAERKIDSETPATVPPATNYETIDTDDDLPF